jgi:hypothetical protein
MSSDAAVLCDDMIFCELDGLTEDELDEDELDDEEFDGLGDWGFGTCTTWCVNVSFPVLVLLLEATPSSTRWRLCRSSLDDVGWAVSSVVSARPVFVTTTTTLLVIEIGISPLWL